MSSSYNDLPLTNYPDANDTIVYKNDISIDTYAKVQQYQSYISSGDFASANSYKNANDDLAKVLIGADDFNKHSEEIVAIERAVKSLKSQAVTSPTEPLPSAQFAGCEWNEIKGTSSSQTYIQKHVKETDGTYTSLCADNGTRTEESSFGDNTHIVGTDLMAGYDNQLVCGKRNKNSAENLFEVGNGDDDGRNNAFAVSKDGNISMSGDIANINGQTIKQYLQSSIIDMIYPVGSIYMSTANASPSAFLGGTWEAIAPGRVLMGAGTGTDANGTSKSFAVGATGGEYTHKLTVAEMPQHNHEVSSKDFLWAWEDNAKPPSSTTRGYIGSRSAYEYNVFNGDTDNTGSDMSHNNMQPYLAVYMWKRTK